MANTGKNNSRFGRFWVLMKGREHMIDKDEIVMQFTDGRTTHLSEMTTAEYHEMCAALEGRFNKAAYEQQLKKARSAVLLRVGRLGINTIDNWDEVNAFLLSPKIAGKLLYDMTIDELKELTRKLEAIIKKGGIKNLHEEERTTPQEELARLISSVNTTTNSKYLS